MVKFILAAYTLHDDTACNGKTVLAGELVVKAQYLICIQENINWYWEKKDQKQVIIFPT